MEAIDWRRFIVLAAAAGLSILNAFIHSRDGYTAVIGQGLVLSGISTALLLMAGWRGWRLSAPGFSSSAQQRSALQ
jgi:uncharacterized membrane protein